MTKSREKERVHEMTQRVCMHANVGTVVRRAAERKAWRTHLRRSRERFLGA